MTVAYACADSAAEAYPGGVQKPRALKWITALVAVIKMGIHIGIFRLEGHPESFPKTSRRFVIGIGGFSACAKLVECLLICYWVDQKMPQDSAGVFCVLAMGFVEGLMAVVAAMAYGATDTVPFDGPGKVFYRMGHFRCCPGLTIFEKRTLLE
ncbi:hypothetical protein FN846DRAFT_892413 [Sphaerosporella brunnea]|uniref:Uncharacterized protein n=1 Tax=Sphaerosporella brunnea TaxID=1250544 RepID=A0A5J5EPX1_9PEZI|nr:hypothetical protein FN846DRAFT_892413 [Sphaerosporella brunnea]